MGLDVLDVLDVRVGARARACVEGDGRESQACAAGTTVPGAAVCSGWLEGVRVQAVPALPER